MLKDVGITAKQLPELATKILNGKFGDELLMNVRARTGDNVDTGFTLSHVGKWRDAKGVSVGIDPRHGGLAKSPAHPRSNAYAVGVWLESGIKPHMIPKSGEPGLLTFGGQSRWVLIEHPGFRATMPAFRSMQAMASTFTSIFTEELDRLAPGPTD